LKSHTNSIAIANSLQEPFVQACITFLAVRCPQLIGAMKDDQPTPQNKSQQLPPETINTMLSNLQSCYV